MQAATERLKEGEEDAFEEQRRLHSQREEIKERLGIQKSSRNKIFRALYKPIVDEKGESIGLYTSQVDRASNGDDAERAVGDVFFGGEHKTWELESILAWMGDVAARQAEHGLAVDGIAGPKTVAAVGAKPASGGRTAAGAEATAAGADEGAAVDDPFGMHLPPAQKPATTATDPAAPPAAASTPAGGLVTGGPRLVAVQRALNAQGFDCGDADGIMGPRTRAAVVAFQRARHLDPDGLIGPLTLGACALRVPERGLDPWRALDGVVSAAIDDDGEKLVVADSKVVFTRNPRGARRLERTVLAFAALAAGPRVVARDGRALLRQLESDLGASSGIEDEFWAAELDAALPRHAERTELEAHVDRLADALSTTGIELAWLAARAVPVRALNASFATTDNKSRTHWLATRDLLERLWQRFGADERAVLDVVVDRQGGRMHYRAALEEAFPDARVVLVRETAPLSQYVVEEPATGKRPARAMRLVFREKAEHVSFAVALASCCAKYARELAMDAQNAWFARREPALVPTAGYVEDGRRWLADAREAIERAGIARDDLVRTR